LVLGAAWSWRLLLVGAAVYAVVRVLSLLTLVVIPLLAALLLAALLRPVTELLRRRLPGPLSALLTLFLAVVMLVGMGYLIGIRFAQELPSLIEQIVGTIHRIRADLAGHGVGQFQLDQLERSVVDWLQRNRSQTIDYLTTGASYLFEFVTLTALTLFIAFFLLYDGERIWRWLISSLPPRESQRVDLAGRSAWNTVTGYVRGTAVIATIHGIVIGLAVSLLGVPLAIPLGVLVFFGAFIPFIGALVAGGLAILVTFGTHGWLPALILLGVLLAESQLETNLLQPLIVGRYVRLHPLAIGLAFAVGTVLAGIVGAIIAVPVAAVIYQAMPALRGRYPAPAPTTDAPPVSVR
jgi:predicted PurR-regulated permease PerM